jgi:hypothetical protein
MIFIGKGQKNGEGIGSCTMKWALSCLLERGVFCKAPNSNLPLATLSPELA